MKADNLRMFETVRKHLLSQRKRSERIVDLGEPLICAYRGDNGLRCAIGALIPDDRYRSEMEGAEIDCEFVDRFELWDLIPNVSLACALQKLHDGTDPADWAEALGEVYDRFFRLD